MNRAFQCFITIVLSSFLLSCSSAKHLSRIKKDVSPYDFGLATAKTGEDRFQVLLDTHRAAVAAGVNVDYTNIDTIEIELPAKPFRIPLTNYNDFKGCVIIVKNNVENCWLFNIVANRTPISIEKRHIDLGDFRSYKELNNGRNLLIIEDINPWVVNRKGHSYGHYRKDVLVIERGRAKNQVVMPYNNDNSKPRCTYIPLDDNPLVLKNLTIVRHSGCTYVTHIAQITGFDNVKISNFILYTPDNNLSSDQGIRIYDCTNVTLDNVKIEGTYSQTDRYGYGITLNNVWNFKATRFFGKGNWGVYGNNNVNVARIEDSQINRFDIHCYGRDIYFKKVDFFYLYNQYSSVYGTIRYDKCTFTDFVPVLNGGSYNAFVEHEVVLNDCVFNVTPKKNALYKVSYLNEANNPRNELSEKCLPNLRIKNLMVNMTGGAERLILYYFTPSGEKVSDIGYVSNISIDGLTINQEGNIPIKEMLLSNMPISTKQPIGCKLANVTVNQTLTKTLIESDRPSIQLKANLPLKGGKATLRKATGIVQ